MISFPAVTARANKTDPAAGFPSGRLPVSCSVLSPARRENQYGRTTFRTTVCRRRSRGERGSRPWSGRGTASRFERWGPPGDGDRCPGTIWGRRGRYRCSNYNWPTCLFSCSFEWVIHPPYSTSFPCHNSCQVSRVLLSVAFVVRYFFFELNNLYTIHV